MGMDPAGCAAKGLILKNNTVFLSSRPLLDGNSFWNRIINPVQADP
jgi:hypothetical protein